MTTSISPTYASIVPNHADHADRIVPGFREVVDFLASSIAHWHARSRQRRRLMSLDDRMLRDIGISRADAADEYAKPFWKA